MEFAGAGHVHPQGHTAVLDEDGGFRVFKDYVAVGIAPVEFVLDLRVQVVVGILGFPVAPVHTEESFTVPSG